MSTAGAGRSVMPALAAALALLCWSQPVAAKTPGTTYCYLSVCHRVLSLAETAAEVGMPVELVASYYDAPWRDPFNPSMITSSGELFRPEADDSAASPIYPDGTRLLVWEPLIGGAVVLRINNAGPYHSDRLLDLSRGAAERLGLLARGVGRVGAVVLTAPEPHEVVYAAGRVYAPVPGYIGTFASLEKAHEAWRALAGEDKATARAMRIQVAEVNPESPPRVVVIPGKPGARRGRGRITLLPVAKRRPMLIRILASRRGAIVRQARR